MYWAGFHWARNSTYGFVTHSVDQGISGASRHNRPALLDLMARMAGWDVLLCWDFSRLARNEEDLGWIRNRLKSAKKTAYEASATRDIHDIGARVLGVISAEYLAKLSTDTHRGLRGRAERGLATGGPARISSIGGWRLTASA